MRHYRCFSGLPGVEVVAVPVRQERVAELASEGVRAAESVPDDAAGVVVATDTSRHLEDWKRFADRFCLIEKPLAGNPSPELAALANTSSGRAFTACVLRFHKTLTAFKELACEQGTPTSKIFVRCHSFLPDWRPGRDYRTMYSAQSGQGGALRELIHEIDYCGWMFGWPATVNGKIAHTGRIEIADEDRAVFSLQSPGSRVSVNLSLSDRVGSREIQMRLGDVVATADLIRQEIRFDGDPTRTVRYPEDRDGMYIRQAEAFVRAIRGASPGQLATAEDGVRALEVCQAVRLSSQTGSPVTL